MNIYSIAARSDFDQTIKIKGYKVPCYSKKNMKERYPQGDYQIVGEISGKSGTSAIGSFTLGNSSKQTEVFKYNSLSRTVYREVGYACVGMDKYVLVLRSRLAAFLWFIGITAGVGIGIVLLIAIIRSKALYPDGSEMNNPLPSIDPYVKEVVNDGYEPQPTKAPEEIKEGDITSNSAGQMSLMYSLDAKLTLSENKIDMFFVNPHNSYRDVVVELYVLNEDEMVLIAETGLIPIGTGVETMEFKTDSALLSNGSYRAEYIVRAFDPNSGELSILNSEISDVVLTVTN